MQTYGVLAQLSGTWGLLRCPEEDLTVPWFFDCMRIGLEEDFAAYQKEYIAALEQNIGKCFKECPFTQNDFKVSSFKDIYGPLKNCKECLFYTETIGDFFLTAARNNKGKLTKFRHYVGDTLANDVSSCMGNFAFARTPDVEAVEMTNMQLKLDAVDLLSKASSRIGMCAVDNERAAKTTSNCIFGEKQLAGKMPLHCGRLNYCATNDLTLFCCHRIKKAVDLTCKCIVDKETSYTDTFKALSDHIMTVKTREDCLNAWNYVTQQDAEWMNTIDDVFTALMPNVKITTILESVCEDLQRAKDAGDKAQEQEIRSATSGLMAFTAHTLGAFLRHITDRFCHCDIDCSAAHSAN